MSEKLESLIDREGLSLASIQKRISAFGIDEVLLSLLLMIVLWEPLQSATTMEAVLNLTNTFLIEYMAMKIVYQTFFVMTYGATLGKIVMKIRVIEIATTSNPAFLSAFNRAVFRVVSEALLYLGFVWGMIDPYRRTWHDLSAKTLVVNA